MKQENLEDLTIAINITRLIGLGEEQRKIYHVLDPQKDDLDLWNAYKLHQEELVLLIKYQNSLQ